MHHSVSSCSEWENCYCPSAQRVFPPLHHSIYNLEGALPVLGMCSVLWARDCDMAGNQSPPFWVWGRDGLLASGEGERGGVGCPGSPDPLLDPCGLFLSDSMAAGLAELASE